MCQTHTQKKTSKKEIPLSLHFKFLFNAQAIWVVLITLLKHAITFITEWVRLGMSGDNLKIYNIFTRRLESKKAFGKSSAIKKKWLYSQRKERKMVHGWQYLSFTTRVYERQTSLCYILLVKLDCWKGKETFLYCFFFP